MSITSDDHRLVEDQHVGSPNSPVDPDPRRECHQSCLSSIMTPWTSPEGRRLAARKYELARPVFEARNAGFGRRWALGRAWWSLPDRQGDTP